MITFEAIRTLALYLVAFSSSVIVAYLYQNSRNKGELRTWITDTLVRCVVVLPVAVLIGCRSYTVGWDTLSMVNSYISNTYSLEYLLVTAHDPLSMVAFKFLSWLFAGNPTGVFFVISFLTLYILASAVVKWGEGLSLSFSLMVYYLFFALIGMDQTKQMLAVSIVLYATACLMKGRAKAFFIIVTIAGLFHFTAFLGYAFYFIRIRESDHPVITAIFIGVCVAGMLFSEQLFSLMGLVFGNGAYSGYFEDSSVQHGEDAGGIGPRFFLFIAPCVFPLLFWKRIPDSVRVLVIVSLIAILPLRLLSYQTEFLGRLAYIPASIIVFAYPLIMASFKAEKRQLFVVVSIVILMSYYFVAFSTSHGVVPYEFAF